VSMIRTLESCNLCLKSLFCSFCSKSFYLNLSINCCCVDKLSNFAIVFFNI
jgi:hypothetical protein